MVVGFAAETENLEANARAKLERKGCDVIVANDVSRPAVFGGDDNEVMVISRGRPAERWHRTSKSAIAERLARWIAAALA